MSGIVGYILGQDEVVRHATDHYIDDIIVDGDLVDVDRVIKLLRDFGLEVKEPQKISDARVLGLHVYDKCGTLHWKRDNMLHEPATIMTKRDVFSFLGGLIGHFPVASWLRPAVAFVKRCCSGPNWDSEVSEQVMGYVDDIWRPCSWIMEGEE